MFEGSVADFLGHWKTFSTHRDRLVPKAGLAPRFTRREQSTKWGGMDRHRVIGDTAPHSHTCSIFPHHHVAIEHLLCAWLGDESGLCGLELWEDSLPGGALLGPEHCWTILGDTNEMQGVVSVFQGSQPCWGPKARSHPGQ